MADLSTTSAARPSNIPRASKLPVPRSTSGISNPRSAASRDTLRTPSTGLSIPRLRTTPSRDFSSSRTISGSNFRNGDSPTGTTTYTPEKSLIKRASYSNFRPTTTTTPVKLDYHEIQGGHENEDAILQDDPTLPLANESRARKPRQSLSERTMETLNNIPPSPVVNRRRSSFFNADSPIRAPTSSRPGSRDATMPPPPRTSSSRPSSSSGPKLGATPTNLRASTNTLMPASATGLNPPKLMRTPVRMKSAINLRSGASGSRLSSTNYESAIQGSSPSPSPNKYYTTTPAARSVSSTAPRALKPRASMGTLFKKPSTSNIANFRGSTNELISPTFSNSSSDNTSTTSKDSKDTASSVSSIGNRINPRESSLALREQIAKAKATKRAQESKQSFGSRAVAVDNEVAFVPTGTFDFGLVADPFNQFTEDDDAKVLLRKRINSARTDGRLNIAAMSLKQIPSEVMNMYNIESVGSGSWAESVDLTRFIAADNELESLGEDVFPDIDPREHIDDDDFEGNQFGGLETLDLHGNLLASVPLGLRRLELLTTLNMSNNKLGNECFDIISQIRGLKELKLANNDISGSLGPLVSGLQNLEVLDLQSNKLTDLPDELAELVNLRVLNVSNNQLVSIPFGRLITLPMVELVANNNRLAGELIGIENAQFLKLQILDITANAVTSLASGTLDLPALKQLNCSGNQLADLPDMTSWKALLNISAYDNRISSIPDGFVSLPQLKTVDFSGNNIVVLDDHIGNMESLDMLRISGNPLRERKYAGMATDDLKRTMRARLTPAEPSELALDSRHTQSSTEESDTSFITATSTQNKPTTEWLVKPGGVLDRSNTQARSLNPVIAAQVANSTAIFTLELHHNMFKEIPTSIGFFAASLTVLSMTHNELTSDSFITEDLHLPSLKELNISSNTFNSLQPLIQHFQAPKLDKLDISFNRLTSLPPLVPHYPSLTVLLVSNNTIKELFPESVKGLRVLDCSSNDLNSLNARIGLLGGPGGLEKLNVSGNRFRVPKYTVLEKGTEATLAWLRDRIPVGET